MLLSSHNLRFFTSKSKQFKQIIEFVESCQTENEVHVAQLNAMNLFLLTSTTLVCFALCAEGVLGVTSYPDNPDSKPPTQWSSMENKFQQHCSRKFCDVNKSNRIESNQIKSYKAIKSCWIYLTFFLFSVYSLFGYSLRNLNFCQRLASR